MSNFFHQLDNQLNDNSDLQAAINCLIDTAFKSRNNFIPLLSNTALTQILIDEKIVEIHEGKAYMVQESLLLAHGVSKVLWKRLQIKQIDSLEKAEDFLEKVEQLEENRQFQLGISAITKMLRPYTLLYLNHHYKYEFNEVLSIKDKTEFNHIIWNRIRPMLKVLPYLNLELEKLFAIMEKQIEFETDLFEWYESIGRLIAKDNSLAWSMLHIAKNRKTINQELIANILNFISGNDFSAAFDELKNLFTDPVFKMAALLGFSFIEYPDPGTIQEVLKLIEQDYDLPSNAPYKNPSGTTCVNIINSSISEDNQKQQAISLLQKMAMTDDIDQKLYLLFDIRRLKNADQTIGDLLKRYYITGQQQESKTWGPLNHTLSKLENKAIVFDLLEQFILKFPKKNFAKAFEFAISKIPSPLLENKITLWLNENQALFNYKAGELIRQLNIKKVYPILDDKLLNKFSIQDIEFIVFKIMGYVVSHESLSSLVFSVLKRTPEEKEINRLVEFAFQEYILFNYKSAAVFLKEKQKKGDKIEKKVARKILREFESRRSARLGLKLLKELQPPSFRIEEYMKRQSKVYDLEQSIKDNSLFLNLGKNIKLRAGLGFFGRHNGKYSPVAPLNKITTQFELPAGEFIDATGQAVFRAYCQSIKRQK